VEGQKVYGRDDPSAHADPAETQRPRFLALVDSSFMTASELASLRLGATLTAVRSRASQMLNEDKPERRIKDHEETRK